MMGAFAHVADVTNPGSRTSRFCLLELVFLGGLGLGSALSGPLFSIAGYAPIYVFALILVRNTNVEHEANFFIRGAPIQAYPN